MTDQMPPPSVGSYVWTNDGYRWMPAPEESTPPPPPALVPTGDGYTWRPAGSPPPPSPDSIHRAPAGSQQRRGGMLGGLIAALFGFFKYGLVLLKFGKLGGTAISFVISVFIFAGIFGWQFGIGALLLIAVHESGHMIFAKAQGLKVSAPIFLGPFGALVTTRGFRDARQEAVVAIGGPVVGTMAALLCYVFAQSLSPGTTRYLFLALAYFGCLVNLFNMIPMSPLDGGRVAGAVSKWANVAGIAILAVVLAGYYLSGAFVNPFLVLILLIGVYTTVSRFQRAKRGQEPPPIPTRTRVEIGIAYLTLLVVCVVGMSVAHSALLSAGIGQQIV
jgi:Zn-dependent protease